MEIVSWNVNGLKSVIKKGFMNLLEKGFDFILLQEIKTNKIPTEIEKTKYNKFIFPAKRNGYSGTMILSLQKPVSVTYGIQEKEFDDEGRVITIEMNKFYVINVYFPNSKPDLSRLNFKLDFDEKFLEYCEGLRIKKPVIIGGDFNVAHEEIDIARPKENERSAGFTKEERDWFSTFLKYGYIDTFRLFTKEGGHYSWWDYKFRARERNVGWRIDYIVVSDELKNKVKRAEILDKQLGSDHAPVYAEIDI